MIDKARPGDGAEQMGPDMSAKCIGSPLLDLITYHMLARGCAPAVDPEASGFSTVSASQQGFAMNAEIEVDPGGHCRRSEEHTSELQSLMRISYAVFCLKKKIKYK